MDIDFKLIDMTLIYRFSLVVFFFVLLGCFSSDDSFGRWVRLDLNDAFSIENKKEYVVGDTIFFELRFSRYLPEEGFSELLDVYETTKSADFGFSFRFQKFSELEGGFREIYISEDFIVADKNNVNDYFYQHYGTVATLNTTNDTYVARVGVILVEAGRFRFDFDNVSIQSPFGSDQVQVEIYHSFSGIGQLDTEFVVTE